MLLAQGVDRDRDPGASLNCGRHDTEGADGFTTKNSSGQDQGQGQGRGDVTSYEQRTPSGSSSSQSREDWASLKQ
ncbi:MAG: hypothetical protein M1815_002032 [Lichina confinis]|nr:MAG: hypothetical protein M1815_002032 [Lichina confinis]